MTFLYAIGFVGNILVPKSIDTGAQVPLRAAVLVNVLLLGIFMINHFDLFGLRQVFLQLRNREYSELSFRTPFFYKFLRHPIMLIPRPPKA